jgi:hypothetical protein
VLALFNLERCIPSLVAIAGGIVPGDFFINGDKDNGYNKSTRGN